MSTILKALRRLEEEDVNETVEATSADDDATGVGEDLRERIFAEEAAAEALAPAPPARPGQVQMVVLTGIGIAVLLVFGFGLNWFLGLDGFGSSGVAEPPSQLSRAPGIATAPAVAPSRVTVPAPAAEVAAVVPQTPPSRPPKSPSAVPPAKSPATPTAMPPVTALTTPPTPPRDRMKIALPSVAESPTQPGRADSRDVADVDGRAARAEEPPIPPTPPSNAPAPKKSVAAADAAGVVPTAATAAANRKASSISSLPEASPKPESVVEERPERVAASKPAVPTVASPPTKAPRTEAEPRATSPAPAVAPIVPERAPEKVAVVVAPKPEPRAEAAPIPAPRRTSAPRPAAAPVSAPSESAAAPPRKITESRPMQAPDVNRIDRRGLPDVVVVRTSWHPTPDRRTARIRVVASEEVLTLRQGDAIGGLVVLEITPSSVLFEAGKVEIRRKVGATQ